MSSVRSIFNEVGADYTRLAMQNQGSPPHPSARESEYPHILFQ